MTLAPLAKISSVSCGPSCHFDLAIASTADCTSTGLPPISSVRTTYSAVPPNDGDEFHDSYQVHLPGQRRISGLDLAEDLAFPCYPDLLPDAGWQGKNPPDRQKQCQGESGAAHNLERAFPLVAVMAG
jgi:hypothetical protein